MKRRVVLYVLGTLHAGGAERQVLTLIKGLDRSRWDPLVCSTRTGTLAGEFAETCPTHVLGKTRAIEPKTLTGLMAVLRQYRPVVVHTYLSTANTWGRLAVMLSQIARTHERPVVVASERSIDTWKTPVHLFADRLLLGVTDALVCNSQAVARYVIEHDRIPAGRVLVIPNGIDLKRVQAYLGCSADKRAARRAALGFQPNDFVIGHIGRSSVFKGLGVLADVLDRMRTKDARAHLLRVAQPPLPDEVAPAVAFGQAIRQRGIADAVVVHPFTPDISAVLAVMDALVQTSTHEGLPNVVMEAMAMEVPVVVTAAGGTVELVEHRKTGWIVPVGDVEGLAAGLERVMRHRSEANEWACVARRRIETEYSVEAMVTRTVGLYERLLERRSS